MPGKKGVNTHSKPVTICMAVGCERKALYRTGAPGRTSDRGYCSLPAHKQLATRAGDTYTRKIEKDADYFG